MLGRMLVEATVTCLEMTSPDQLVEWRPPPAPVALERHGPAALPLPREVCAGIDAPHRWITRTRWSPQQ